MRRPNLFILTMLLLSISATSAHAAPLDIDTTQLSVGDPQLDGKSVRFSGEAIGEALKAGGDYRWVNVLQEGVAIGVFTSAESIEGIDGYGGWAQNGTTIEVTGVHHVACEQHGGDLDVHATSVEILSPASARQHTVHPIQAVLALLGALLAAVLALRYRQLRHRSL